MARYVDGFVIVVPKKKLEAYKKLAKKAGKIWKEYGALDYVETYGEDLKIKFGTPFSKLAGAKGSDIVIFSYITYKSKKHRDAVNKKVMADGRVSELCSPKDMPFDMQRMSYGGFEAFVDL